MTTKFTALCLAVTMAGLASIAAPAIAMSAAPTQVGLSLPAEQYQGAVGFITGGVGRSEAKLFEQEATRYPLAIELLEHAGKSGKIEEFTADAMVKIADTRGHVVLNAQASGPFMLVDLAPGRYSIRATFANGTLRKSSVVVAPGKTARATFEFPAKRSEALRLSMREGVAQAGLGG